MSIENRQSVRYLIEVAAEVLIPGAIVAAKTRNLSKTGVCFDLDVELPEDSTVGVSLFLVADGIEDPDSEPLNIAAKVMWCSPRNDHGYSAGMRFEFMEPEAKSALDTFMKSRYPN